MATLNELFETYVNANFDGTMSEAAIVKAYELLLGLTGDFADKSERVQFWVDKNLAVSEFVDEFLATAARLSAEKAAAWGETVTARTAVVTAAQNAAATATTLEEIGSAVATAYADTQPQTFTLTTGTDSGDSFKGGAGDDTYTASLLTLTSADALDGGAGTDTLTAEINGTVAATTEIANIENIVLTSFGANTVNLDKITGVTSLTSKDSTGQVTLEKAVATTALGFEGSSTNDVVANYAAGALAGASDALTVNLNAASAVKLDVDSGFESATINLTGSNSLTTLTVPGVTTLTLAGSGDLALNNTLSGFTTVTATGMTGALKGNTISAATGLSTEGFTGHANGTSVLLGSGADNIKFTDATSANKSNTIKLGAGNDTLHILTAGAGASYVFAEAGDDAVTADSIAQKDLIDLGEGTDTLTLTGTTNVGVLRGVENLVVDVTSSSNSVTINSADSSQAISVKTDADGTADVTLAGLVAGSTVAIDDSTSGGTGDIDDISIGFAATEASSTVDVNTAVSASSATGITVSKVTDLTLDFAKAAAITTGDLSVDDTTTLTITAAKSLDLNGIGSATTDALKTVTITGSDAVTTGNIANSDKLETLSVTAGSTKALSVGDVVAAKELDAVTFSGASVTAGTLGGTTAADDLNTVTATAATGNIQLNLTTADDDAIAATKLGTVTLTADAGSISVVDAAAAADTVHSLVNAADSTGITVNLSAKTNIAASDSGSNDFDETLLVTNEGLITASLAGSALAVINYTADGTAAAGSVVNLTASNTGGLTSTVTNNSTAGGGGTSTVTLGNAGSGKTNALTVGGISDTLTINGGSGKDEVTIGSTTTVKTATISLGSSLSTDLDKVDFTAIVGKTDANNGIAINLGSTSHTFDSGTANATSVAAGTAVDYDDNGTKKVVDSSWTFTLSGVESVVGTDAGDYIIANAAGTTIDGGAGADVIIGGAGVDTIIAGAGDDVITAGGGNDTITLGTGANTLKFASSAANNGADTINSFTVANDDKLDFTAFVTGRAIGTDGAGDTGATAIDEFTTSSTDARDLKNKIAFFDDAGTPLTTTTLAAEFAAGAAFAADTDQTTKAVVLSGNVAGANGASIWYVDASLDGAVGVSASDVVLVGTIAGIDMDTIEADLVL